MKRKDVYKLIDGERDYQNDLPFHSDRQDKKYSIADWVILIEYQINEAKADLYCMEYGEAKEHIRKIAALCVACMEHNRTNQR